MEQERFQILNILFVALTNKKDFVKDLTNKLKNELCEIREESIVLIENLMCGLLVLPETDKFKISVVSHVSLLLEQSPQQMRTILESEDTTQITKTQYFEVSKNFSEEDLQNIASIAHGVCLQHIESYIHKVFKKTTED